MPNLRTSKDYPSEAFLMTFLYLAGSRETRRDRDLAARL
jgi:hypothetical protein